MVVGDDDAVARVEEALKGVGGPHAAVNRHEKPAGGVGTRRLRLGEAARNGLVREAVALGAPGDEGEDVGAHEARHRGEDGGGRHAVAVEVAEDDDLSVRRGGVEHGAGRLRDAGEVVGPGEICEGGVEEVRERGRIRDVREAAPGDQPRDGRGKAGRTGGGDGRVVQLPVVKGEGLLHG